MTQFFEKIEKKIIMYFNKLCTAVPLLILRQIKFVTIENRFKILYLVIIKKKKKNKSHCIYNTRYKYIYKKM